MFPPMHLLTRKKVLRLTGTHIQKNNTIQGDFHMIIDFDLSIVLIGSLIYIGICFYLYKKKKKEKVFFLFGTIMFCYFMCIIKLTLFPIVMLGLPANIKESVHLIPFQDGIRKTDLLNLLMTIPLGIGTPFLAPIYNLKRSALLGLFTGIVIEVIQYLETFLTGGFSYRIIDSNDVIFNFIGCLLGFLALAVFSNFFKQLPKERLNSFWRYVHTVCSNIHLYNQTNHI